VTAVLEISGLSHAFRGARPRVQALSDVSLQMEAGEALAILGESGSGKSTLARCMARLIQPDSGSVRFDGVDLRRATLGVQLLQPVSDTTLDPRLSVAATIGEPLLVHRLVPRAFIPIQVNALLDLVKLPSAAAQAFPHDLNAAQRQRIGLARALALEPRLIVADEALGGMDVSVQAQFIQLLLELQAQRRFALVFMTRDPRLVHAIARHVAVLYRGRVVETGPMEVVFNAPRHPYTQALLRAVPRITPGPARTEAALPEEGAIKPAPTSGCAFQPRCPVATPRCTTERPDLAARGGDWKVACLEAG
jgi:oligopeptide/dipeptide ABC transporter ATP-binding protein